MNGRSIAESFLRRYWRYRESLPPVTYPITLRQIELVLSQANAKIRKIQDILTELSLLCAAEHLQTLRAVAAQVGRIADAR